MQLVEWIGKLQDLAHQGYANFDVDFSLKNNPLLLIGNPRITVHTSTEEVEIEFDSRSTE